MPLPLAVAVAVFTASASGLAWLSRQTIRRRPPKPAKPPYAAFHDRPITADVRVAVTTGWCPECDGRRVGEHLASGRFRCAACHHTTRGDITHAAQHRTV